MSTYTQEDRMADRAYFANKAREEAIAKWLQENPQVGVLNSGKYYIYPDGHTYTEIEALSVI